MKWLFSLLLALPSLAAAVEPGQVREFGDVFRISASADKPGAIEVSWDIAKGYYLYNNKFLKFRTETPGVVLGPPDIPEGERAFDELLGEEVVKYHDRLTVVLPLEFVPPGVELISLKVSSQGCQQDVLCYPPTEQWLSVEVKAPAARDVPAGVSGPAGPAAGLFKQLSAGAGSNGPGPEPALPPGEAFAVEAIGLSGDTVLARLTAQPGYYLYRDKLAFRVTGPAGFEVREVALPRGVIEDDPEFGATEVFFGQVEVPVRLGRPAGGERSVDLEVDFQGCRDGDICYPPQSARISVLMPAWGAGSGAAAGPLADLPVSEQGVLARMLLDNPAAALFAFFVAGILLAFTPCVLPMVPILSGIIAGQAERMTTARAFWLSLVYVLAMALTYTAAGVLAGLFGQNLQALFQNPWILGGFIAVFIALALSMFGFFELQLPPGLQTRLADASNRQQGGSLTGVAVMGFLSALIVGPCVAPPLAAALIVIGASGDAFLGGAALFALSIGMGVPLILFGVSAGKLVPRAGPWMNAVKAAFGVGLLALAVWMLERIVQGPVILLLWGVLAIGSGVYLGALENVPAGASGWRRLWKSAGLVLLLLGALEIIGAATGGSDWLKPLGNVRPDGRAVVEQRVGFQRIKSLADLRSSVALANQAGKPAMLDFYADWCVECLRMERTTFREPEIQALFERLQPLQADVTANDATDRALMAEYGVIGPPAILFFDRRGNELPGFRLVGYFGPGEFAAHLRKVLESP